LDEITGAKGNVLVGRRVPLPDGGEIVLLAARYHRLHSGIGTTRFTVIELHPEEIDAAAVLRCLRYMGVLHAMIEQDDLWEANRRYSEYCRTYDWTVGGIVCAPKITPEAGLAVAACNVTFTEVSPGFATRRVNLGGAFDPDDSACEFLAYAMEYSEYTAMRIMYPALPEPPLIVQEEWQ
jgi:hypothetical protein